MFHRFYTLDKKPTVWNILFLTVLMLLGMAVILSRHTVSTPWFLAVYYAYHLAVLVLLLRAFFRQLRYDPYSYNTIYYAGFSILVFVYLIQVFILTSHGYFWDYSPELRITNLIGLVIGSAKSFMILTSPIVLIFALALCLSNIVLIRHEGRRFVNILGILLSVLMVGGIAFLWRADYYVSGSKFYVMVRDMLTNLFASVYLYFECMVIGTAIAMAIVTTYKPEKDKDHILILGCGLKKDGTPTPLLKGRADRALSFYREQIAETGHAPVLVPSGGQGPDEVCAESQSMASYLMEQGVPEEHILQEDRSVSTFENMRNSRDLLRERGGEGNAAFSTTNYHVFRSGLMASRVGMRAVGMGSRTKWYFWPNAAVREFVGLLTDHRVKQAVILGCMVLFYVVTVFLYYHFLA